MEEGKGEFDPSEPLIILEFIRSALAAPFNCSNPGGIRRPTVLRLIGPSQSTQASGRAIIKGNATGGHCEELFLERNCRFKDPVEPIHCQSNNAVRNAKRIRLRLEYNHGTLGI